MYLRKNKKGIAVLSALIMGSVLLGSVTKPYGVNAADNQPDETSVPEATEYIPFSIHGKTEDSKEETVVMWKAQLSEYENNLSVVDYETVEVEEEEETEEEIIARGVINNDTANYIEADVNAASDPVWVSDSVIDPESVPEIQEAEQPDVQPGNFCFATYGYGHGVGLSQNGANHYASYAGWDYQQILQHYYPGTYIVNSGTAEKETISAGGVSGSALDIVSMVVNTEIGSGMSTEAIKAQAVAIYTYIKYYGGSVDDLYTTENPPQNVVDAVKSVLGEAVCYDGGYALTMFCASSGGSTASCYDIFYEDIPYLRSVSSEYDSQCDPHYGSTEVISAEDVKSALESNLGITLSDDPSNWISIIEGDGGYAAYVEIDGQVTIKGNDFRYYLGLKSPKFTCTYY
ncbi:SpoIID/LytB domain-containing protein [Porcipelethomonas sp.]|uniref:SpoIID/LytB domain-containing protein n=1 Tax=Porcipelethomonas sp. TaxID=2981675 RepID=UPI003EFA362A